MLLRESVDQQVLEQVQQVLAVINIINLLGGRATSSMLTHGRLVSVLLLKTLCAGTEEQWKAEGAMGLVSERQVSAMVLKQTYWKFDIQDVLIQAVIPETLPSQMTAVQVPEVTKGVTDEVHSALTVKLSTSKMLKTQYSHKMISTLFRCRTRKR